MSSLCLYNGRVYNKVYNFKHNDYDFTLCKDNNKYTYFKHDVVNDKDVYTPYDRWLSVFELEDKNKDKLDKFIQHLNNKNIKSKKQIFIVAIIASCIIFILSSIIFSLLTDINIDFSSLEMPIVYVIKNKFSNLSLIYGLIILIAIFTTAVSIGASFLNNVSKNKKDYRIKALIMSVASVIISNIGFSNLVKVLFPMFGYMGILQILLIVTIHGLL